METALYFPYMSAPQTPWFTKVLLYWDSAATIVPSIETMNLSPYMDDLMGNNLVAPVDPSTVLDDMPYGFADSFMELLDHEAAGPDRRRRRWGLVSRRNRRRSSVSHWNRVHEGKMAPRIFRELERRGLARRYDLLWWEMEPRTARLYMEWLAGGLCLLSRKMVAVTEGFESIANLHTATKMTSEERLRDLRFAAVTNALPAPSKPVSPSELRSFKDEHGDKLRELRSFLNGRLADLTKESDEYLREVKSAEVHREIRDSVAELSAEMSKRRWPKLTFWGVGGVSIPALTQVPAISNNTDSPLILGFLAAASLAGVLKQGYEFSEWHNAPKYDGRNPLVYAALAGKL